MTKFTHDVSHRPRGHLQLSVQSSQAKECKDIATVNLLDTIAKQITFKLMLVLFLRPQQLHALWVVSLAGTHLLKGHVVLSSCVQCMWASSLLSMFAACSHSCRSDLTALSSCLLCYRSQSACNTTHTNTIELQVCCDSLKSTVLDNTKSSMHSAFEP